MDSMYSYARHCQSISILIRLISFLQDGLHETQQDTSQDRIFQQKKTKSVMDNGHVRNIIDAICILESWASTVEPWVVESLPDFFVANEGLGWDSLLQTLYSGW